ncbi:unnamed protein product [Bursaphelenchus xylophilus]|uniref:(pine wood nematode) hypothetical protein n=1 Tax=Bursaphelenchus xylophilus TaxID=6326 RepID=A0A1I7SLH8_BURXY|nr:unnamed protein product [Bursaphelenchus xylophilus]CAG9129605.1 unnamed protein product [Bursaphelenchus xylophilus]
MLPALTIQYYAAGRWHSGYDLREVLNLCSMIMIPICWVILLTIVKRLNKKTSDHDIEYATLTLNMFTWMGLMFSESLFLLNMYDNKTNTTATYNSRWTALTSYTLSSCVIAKTMSVWAIVTDKILHFSVRAYRWNRAECFLYYPLSIIVFPLLLVFIQMSHKWPEDGYERCGSIYCRSNKVLPMTHSLQFVMGCITVAMGCMFQRVFDRADHCSFEYTAYRNITFTVLSTMNEVVFAFVPIFGIWLSHLLFNDDAQVTYNNLRTFLPQLECFCVTMIYCFRFRLWRLLIHFQKRLITGYGASTTSMISYYDDSDTTF